MVLWLIILGTALAGGLLVLHGFGKAKETHERMLDYYQGLLDRADAEEDYQQARDRQAKPEHSESNKAPDHI